MAILTLQQRIRECGRIRIGQKGPNGAPQKLSTFRFTSFDRRAIQAAADKWGGIVKECTDKDLKGQFEVVTNTSEIPIMAANTEPTQYMELWSGGGCERRCDGCTELLSGKACLCDPEDQKCKPTTRLSIILPDLPGLGVWRIESHGWNVAAELIQTYDFLRALTGRRELAEAMLAIEERTGRVDKKTTRFMVPVIRIPVTPRALMESRGELGMGEVHALSEGAPALPASHETPEHVLKDPNPRGAVFAILHEMKLPPHEDEHKAMYYKVFGTYLQRELTTLGNLTDEEWAGLASWLKGMQEGKKSMPKAFKDAVIVDAEWDPMQGGGDE